MQFLSVILNSWWFSLSAALYYAYWVVDALRMFSSMEHKGHIFTLGCLTGVFFCLSIFFGVRFALAVPIGQTNVK